MLNAVGSIDGVGLRPPSMTTSKQGKPSSELSRSSTKAPPSYTLVELFEDEGDIESPSKATSYKTQKWSKLKLLLLVVISFMSGVLFMGWRCNKHIGKLTELAMAQTNRALAAQATILPSTNDTVELEPRAPSVYDEFDESLFDIRDVVNHPLSGPAGGPVMGPPMGASVLGGQPVMGPQAMGPQAVGPQAMGPQAMGPQAMGPQAIGPQAMGPQAIGPQAMGPQAMGPQAVGPQAMGPQAMGPQAMGPQAMGPQAIGPQAVGPQAMGPREARLNMRPVVGGAADGSMPSNLQAMGMAKPNAKGANTLTRTFAPPVPTSGYASTCTFVRGKQKDPRRYPMVLLASYPRSGNSWTRLLLHGGHQYLDSGLTTLKMNQLTEVSSMSTCRTCPDKAIASYIRHELMIVPDSMRRGDQAQRRPIYGIHKQDEEVVAQNACSGLFNLRTLNPNWNLLRPPVMIKTHFPVIQEPTVEQFTKSFDRLIYLSRNPFDNIASRYLGHDGAHQDRWDKLIAARRQGQTTDEFDAFMRTDILQYYRFHKYWITRREQDLARGTSILFTRYESLCSNTLDIAKSMVIFGGWNLTLETLSCTLKEAPCVADINDMPNHLDIYTEDQIAFVLEAVADILPILGYSFITGSHKLVLSEPQIPHCG